MGREGSGFMARMVPGTVCCRQVQSAKVPGYTRIRHPFPSTREETAMDVRLDGRSAVITGGSKGLGLAMAQKFASSGADVAILARDADALEAARQTIAAESKGRVVAFSCDVSKAEQIERAYDGAIKALGKVDIVVNNA